MAAHLGTALGDLLLKKHKKILLERREIVSLASCCSYTGGGRRWVGAPDSLGPNTVMAAWRPLFYCQGLWPDNSNF
jgi:hypothetical protein